MDELFNPGDSYKFLSLPWRLDDDLQPSFDNNGNIITDAQLERKPTSHLILKMFGLGESVILSEEQCAYLAGRFAAITNPNKQQEKMAELFKTVASNIRAEREGRKPISPYHLTPLSELK